MAKSRLVFLAIFSFIFFLLSYVIPKQKNLILFGASHGRKFGGNPKYLYLTLLKNKKYKPVWITKKERIFSGLKKLGLPTERYNSLRGIFLVLRAKWIFFNYDPEDLFFWQFLFGRFNAVNTWHSVPIKLMGNDEYKQPKMSLKRRVYSIVNNILGMNKKIYEIMVSTSEFSSGNLKTAFNPRKILLSGYPKDDLIFDDSVSTETLCKKINLKKYKKVFFYAPTLRESKKLNPFSKALSLIDRYLEKTNSVLLITKHPSTEEIDVKGKYKRILDITSEVEDTQELLKYADVFITDYSGLMVNFALTNNPIILYCYDFQDYKKGRGMYIDLEKTSPGILAKNENKLFEAIRNIDKLSKSKEVRKRYKEFKDRYQKYQHGGNSKRLLSMLGIN